MTANENEEPRAHLERAGGSAEGTLGQPGATGAHTAEDPGDHHPPISTSSSSSSMGACDLDIMEGGGIGGEEKGNCGWGSAVVSPAAPDQSLRTHLCAVVDDPSIPSNTNNESISTSDLRISFMETGGQRGGGGGGGGCHAGDDTADTNDSAGSAQAIPSPTLVPAGDVVAMEAEETDWCKLLLVFFVLLIFFLAVAEGLSQLIYGAFSDSFSLSKLRKGCYGAASAMVAVVISVLLARKYITSAAADRLRDCFKWIPGVTMLIAGCVCAEGVTDNDV